MADDAIDYMNRINAIDPDQPFFVYYVPGGTHAPHHPTPEWIKKISDMHLFDQGWNKLRETIFDNQKKLGVIPPGRQADALAEGPAQGVGPAHRRREEDVHPPGGRLRRLRRLHRPRDRPRHPGGRGHGQARQHADHLHQRRQRHQRRGHAGRHAQRDRDVQRRRSCRSRTSSSTSTTSGAPTRPTPTWRCGWAWAFDTPFTWTKQIASHLGGIRQGMAISWPKVIKDTGGIRNQFHHVIDVVPTILEATGITQPEVVDGIKQKPDRRRQHGVHLRREERERALDAQDAVLRDVRRPRASTTTAGSPAPRSCGRRGSCRRPGAKDPMTYPWELYDLNDDWTRSPRTSRRSIPRS